MPAHASKRPLAEVRKICGTCHQDQALELVKGVHSKAGEVNDQGFHTPLLCTKCHGAQVHQILPINDKHSPVFANNQVQLCGGCHEKDLKTYLTSSHGFGLEKSAC